MKRYMKYSESPDFEVLPDVILEINNAVVFQGDVSGLYNAVCRMCEDADMCEQFYNYCTQQGSIIHEADDPLIVSDAFGDIVYSGLEDRDTEFYLSNSEPGGLNFEVYADCSEPEETYTEADIVGR